MSGLTLRLANAPALRVDLRQLTPAALAGMAPDAIARLPLWHGNERIALGELFDRAGPRRRWRARSHS
ncbi:hypothetical protein ACU4HD_07260 [Cupriavidus basilensis]